MVFMITDKNERSYGPCNRMTPHGIPESYKREKWNGLFVICLATLTPTWQSHSILTSTGL